MEEDVVVSCAWVQPATGMATVCSPTLNATETLKPAAAVEVLVEDPTAPWCESSAGRGEQFEESSGIFLCPGSLGRSPHRVLVVL